MSAAAGDPEGEQSRTGPGFREAHDRMRDALDAVSVGVWECEIASGRVMWGDVTERLHGVQPGTFGGTFDAFIALIHPDDQAAVLRQVEEGRRRHADRRYSYRTIWPDGSEHWIECIGRTIEPPGMPARAVGVCMDITAHKRLQEHLHQAQKMESIGNLAGGVAHDFNNLLTVIGGECEALSSHVAGNRGAHEAVETIRIAAMSAAALTRQLLTFSRQQVVVPRHVNVNDTIRGFQKVLRRLIEENVQIDLHLAPAVGAVRIDPGQLEQLLLNLVINARDAMPNGGTITIATREEAHREDDATAGAVGSYVVLSVTDTGVGMPPDVQARLFEPFFTTKAQGRGTGLGLVTVQGIVTQYGGHVSLTSKEQAGTAFKVYLPVAVGADAARLIAKPAAGDLRGSETVLVVEDNGSVRRFIERALRGHGYRVLGAAGATQAREISTAHAGAIDVVLTDVVMPDGSGPAISDWICRQRPEARTLYMSGYVADYPAVARSTAFLQKPFTATQLLAAVREVLRSERIDPAAL